MTIGIPTYDDYDGLYFTVMSLRLYHPAVADCEILVVDNNPAGPAAKALDALQGWIPNYRYLPYDGVTGTAIVHEIVFREARHEHVLCMDCHVLVAPGAVDRLAAYFAANPGTRDLLHGPLVYDDLKSVSTHMEPRWSTGMFGVWATDQRGVDPAAPSFEIPAHGVGLFACRRDAWPGINPLLRGFGGEEFYVHEKFRRAGGRVLCLPWLRWIHRFNRPKGIPYRNIWEDRIWNYFVIHQELGLDTAPLVEHFRSHLGAALGDRIVAQVRAEMQARGLPPC
jgi:hypothetical protein